MKFTLRTKLFVLTTFVVTLVMVTVTLVVTLGQARDRRNGARAQAFRLARSVANFSSVEDRDWTAYQQFIAGVAADNDDVVFIAVHDDRRALRAHALNLELLDIGDADATSARGRSELVRRLDEGAVASQSRDDLHTERVEIKSGSRVLGHVAVGISAVKLSQQTHADLVRNVLLALVFICVSGLLSLLLGGRLTGPLERLGTAMSAIAAGDLEQRVAAETHDEIGALALTFNEMAEGLREGRIIEQLGQELAATFQIDRLARLVRERLTVAIGASGARLFLRQPGSPDTYREQSEDLSGAASSLLVLDADCQAALAEGATGALAEPAAGTLRLALAAAGIGATELVVPLLIQERPLGVLAFRVTGGAFALTPKRRHFAFVLARQAALALDNALLYDALREQERMRGELGAARDVQQRLLPRRMPELAGWEFTAACIPAREVGGDYFDWMSLPDRRLGLVVADVSGKGSAASMYMAQLKGMMLALIGRGGSPAEVLCELNRTLYPTLDRRVFASVLYGVLDPDRHELRFARAGHCPLLVVRASGSTEFARPEGMAIGLDSGARFDKVIAEGCVGFAPGDLVAAYTDGLTDAMSPEREAWGNERMVAALVRERDREAGSLRDSVLEQVSRFAGGGTPFDDLTFLLVRRSSPSADAGGTTDARQRIA